MRIILASGSAARREMLAAVGLDFEVVPADLDEEALIGAQMQGGAAPEAICPALARAKALAVAQEMPDSLVIGADQMLYDDRAVRLKSRNPESAVGALMALQGRTHHLISCACVARGGVILWEGVQAARMTMRAFDSDFARLYVEKCGSDWADCVGGYAVERKGAWLFSEISGDGFAIRGLPLIPLLNFLGTQGVDL